MFTLNTRNFIIILVVLLGLLAYMVMHRPASNSAPPAAGTTAGSGFVDIDSRPLVLDGCKGKVLIVDFWATWCGPCRRELPNVIGIYNKYHSQGLDITGVSADNMPREEFRAWLQQAGIGWPQYWDGLGWGNKVFAQYGIRSIPATFIYDRQGKLAAQNLRGPDLEAKVAELLGSH